MDLVPRQIAFDKRSDARLLTRMGGRIASQQFQTKVEQEIMTYSLLQIRYAESDRGSIEH